MKKKVLVLTLGGTISMVSQSQGKQAVPELDGQALMQSVPELAELADIEVRSIHRIPGASLTFPDMIEIAKMAKKALESNNEGVVVVQGTDTLEESAFLVNLLVNSSKPVIFTGAMRNPSQLSPDGPSNLTDAIRVAVSPVCQDLGTLVVMDQKIHSAYYVCKSHTSSLAAFTSPDVGPLGWIIEGEPKIRVRPANHYKVNLEDLIQDPAVALLTIAMNEDGRLLSQIEPLGFKGLVVEGFGVGHVPERVAPELTELASRMPVVLSSRITAGEVFRNTYGFKGSESELLKNGLIYSGWLGGIRSRVLLYILLSKGYSTMEIRDAFKDWNY